MIYETFIIYDKNFIKNYLKDFNDYMIKTIYPTVTFATDYIKDE